MTMRVATRRVLLYPAAVASGGWWNDNGAIGGAIGAWDAIGAASLAASYVDLTGTGNDLTVGVAPTLTGGWVFNGSTQYLISPITHSGTGSVIIRFSDLATPQASSLFGGQTDTSSYILMYIDSGANNISWANVDDGSDLGTSPAVTSGVFAMAGRKRYRDGVLDGADLPAVVGGHADTDFIGCRRSSTDTAIQFSDVKIQAMSYYSTTLSATDVATITTAMAALT